MENKHKRKKDLLKWKTPNQAENNYNDDNDDASQTDGKV